MASWTDDQVAQARGVVQEQLREKSALEVLELAARLALRGSAESWLCVVDQVVARLEPFPIKEWPVLLQLLMAAENVEVQEADFFVHCAGSLEARAKTEKLGRRADFAKQLACFADLLRLRGVWLGAVSGMIDTIEELGECITRSVSSDLSKAEATENPGTIMDESNFNIEVGIKMNGKGDFSAFWAGLATNIAMTVGCYIIFLVLRKLYPMLYEHNQEVIEKLKQERFKLSSSVFAPVIASSRVTVDDAIEAVGLDHGMLLQFAQFVMTLMLMIGIPALVLLCPMFALAGGHAAQSRLSFIGFANVKENSLVCYPVALFVWYVVIVTQWKIFSVMENKFQQRRKDWLMRMPMPRSQTVLLECIPEEFRSQKALKEFFEDIFGGGCIDEIFFVRDTTTLMTCTKIRDECSQDLHEAEFAWDKSGEADEDARKKLEAALDVAEKKVEEARQEVLESEKGHSASAFVTFKDQKQSIMALNMRYTADDEEFVVSVPPDPADVRYNDLRVDYRVEAAGRTLGYGMIAGLFFGFIPIVAGVTNLLTLESVTKVDLLNTFFDNNPSLAAMWSSLASTLGLTIFMSFLPTFLVLIFNYCFALKADAWEQHLIQQWYFYFLVVYVLLVTAVGTSLWERSTELIENPTAIFSLLANSLPNASHFYLNYVPLQWSTHAMNMTRYINVFKYVGFRKVCSEERARSKAEPEDQDYYGIGSRSARHTLIAVTGLVFCTLCPLICILCLINGCVCRFFYGFLSVYAEEKKADLGGVFWLTQMRHMQQGLLVYLILMTGVLLERGQNIVPGVIAGSSAALWVWTYRRFNHKFHLENLPLRDLKAAASGDKRETSRAKYMQPVPRQMPQTDCFMEWSHSALSHCNEEALLRAQRALRAFAAAVTREAFLLALEAGHTPMPSRGQVLEAAKPLEAAFPVCWLRWAPRRLAEAADLGQRGVPASEAPKLRPPTLKPLAKGRGYGAVVVTTLMPGSALVALNEATRKAGAAFVLAVNMGVTASIFSDFGAKHVISDEDGEPTQMLAVSAAEVVPVSGIVKVDGRKEGEKVLVLTLASDHGLQDGDTVALDDMRGSLDSFNGRQLKVRRFGVVSPTDAKVDLKDVSVKEMLKYTTAEVLSNFQRQYDHYKSEFDSSGAEGKFKQREITLFNRLVLDVE
ncbi:unnamed protein product, partial [Effrenium voratum]